MANTEQKNLDSPDETRPLGKGKFDVVKLGGGTVGRGTFQPGWRWSTDVKPIVGTDSCQGAHFGYMLSGRMMVRMNDGKEFEAKAGDVVAIPSGHDAWIPGNEPCVFIDWAAATDYGKPK